MEEPLGTSSLNNFTLTENEDDDHEELLKDKNDKSKNTMKVLNGKEVGVDRLETSDDMYKRLSAKLLKILGY